MTHRSTLRTLAAPLAFLFALMLAVAFVLTATSAHAQELPDPGDLLPLPDDPNGDNGPDEDNGFDDFDDNDVDDVPQVTETPVGPVAAGGGGTSGGSSATPLLLFGAVTLAGAGALLARRNASTVPAEADHR